MPQNASLDVIAAYMVAISAVSLLIVQVLKTSVLNRFAFDDGTRMAWIQLINYVINFALLLIVLGITHGFDNTQFLFYLLAPLMQGGTASTAFQFISATQKATPATPPIPMMTPSTPTETPI